jgi:DNA repair ATPase RecN
LPDALLPTQENVKAACTLAQDFDIQRMQHAADAWLACDVKMLACSVGDWTDYPDLAEQLKIGELSINDLREKLGTTRALARAFPFLTACKEACETVLDNTEEDDDDCERLTLELDLVRDQLRDAEAQLAQLRAAQPRKELRAELVRCT